MKQNVYILVPNMNKIPVSNFQGALERLIRRFSLVSFILMGGPGTGVTSPVWEALGTR